VRRMYSKSTSKYKVSASFGIEETVQEKISLQLWRRTRSRGGGQLPSASF
jgi:hypothetical protein